MWPGDAGSDVDVAGQPDARRPFPSSSQLAKLAGALVWPPDGELTAASRWTIVVALASLAGRTGERTGGGNQSCFRRH